MNDKPLPMGKVINSHFGYLEFHTDVLEVGVFDDHLEVTCEDGVYLVTKDAQGRLIVEPKP